MLYMSKPLHVDEDDPNRGESQQPPTTVVASFDRDIREIFSQPNHSKEGCLQKVLKKKSTLYQLPCTPTIKEPIC